MSESDQTNSSSQSQLFPTDSLKKPFVSSKDDLFSSPTFKHPSFDSYYVDDDDDDDDDEEVISKKIPLPEIVERNKKTTYIGKNPINRGLFGETSGISESSNSIDVFDVVEQVDQFRFSFNLSSFEEALERKASLQARSIPIVNSKDELVIQTEYEMKSDVLLDNSLLDRVLSDADRVESPEQTLYRLEVHPEELQDFIKQVDQIDEEEGQLQFSYSSDKSISSSGAEDLGIRIDDDKKSWIDENLVKEASSDENEVYLTELEEMLKEKLNETPSSPSLTTTKNGLPVSMLAWRILKTIKYQAYPGEMGLDLLSMIYFGTMSISLSLYMDVIVAKLLQLCSHILKLPFLQLLTSSDTLVYNVCLSSGLFLLLYLSFRADLKEQFAVTVAKYLWSLPFIQVLRFLACFFIKRVN